MANDAEATFSHGSVFGGNYTWGKALSYTGGGTALVAGGDTAGGIEDFFDVKIERSLSVGDVAHDFRWTSFTTSRPCSGIRESASRFSEDGRLRESSRPQPGNL